MTDRLDATASGHLVAIDVAKDWNVVLYQDINDSRRSFKVANRRADHDRFIGFLKSLPEGSVTVALEPTGDYHRPLAFRLLAEGMRVFAVSSVAWPECEKPGSAHGTRTILKMLR